MVDLQTITTMFGGIGVGLAAVYYILTLNETRKNRRVTLTSNLMQMFQAPENMRHFIEFLHMEWKDYGDFEAKYGTENNLESASVRLSNWQTYSTLGELLRKGLVDEDTIYSTLGWGIVATWQKFESVIREHRKRYMSRDQWTGFEYLADRMLARMNRVDPDYRVPATYDKYIQSS